MLTYSTAFRPSDNTEFTGASANANGFFVTAATTGTLTCTLWRNDGTEWSVILQAGIAPANGVIPLALKKVVASVKSDLDDVIVIKI